MAKPRKLTNADKVVLRLAEAIQRGHVVAFSGAGGRGTVGPYHVATGPARFAAFFDGSSWTRHGVHSGRAEGNAQSVAWAVVDAIGVANTIEALKAAQVGYVNLDTPITNVAGGRRGQQHPLPFKTGKVGEWATQERAALLPGGCHKVTFRKDRKGKSQVPRTVSFCRKERTLGPSKYQRFVKAWWQHEVEDSALTSRKRGRGIFRPSFAEAAAMVGHQWNEYLAGRRGWPGR